MSLPCQARLQPQKEVTPAATVEREKRNPGSLKGPETPGCQPGRERLVVGCPGYERRRTAGSSPGDPGLWCGAFLLSVTLGASRFGASSICTSDSCGTWASPSFLGYVTPLAAFWGKCEEEVNFCEESGTKPSLGPCPRPVPPQEEMLPCAGNLSGHHSKQARKDESRTRWHRRLQPQVGCVP